MPNVLESTQYPLTRFTWDWQTINSLYRSHWIVRRIIDTIPEDMCKNGYKILSQLAPDAIRKVMQTDRKTRTTARIPGRAKTWPPLWWSRGAHHAQRAGK